MLSSNDFTTRVDRVLKHALNLDRYERPSPFEVTIEETPKETTKETASEEKTNESTSESHTSGDAEKGESSEQL